MHLCRRNGKRYRLVVTVGQRGAVWDTTTFHAYEHAQSQVAAVVSRYAPLGVIETVSLQHSNSNGAGMSASPVVGQPCDTPVWTTEREWGRDVVERILAQAALRRPAIGNDDVPVQPASHDAPDHPHSLLPPTRAGLLVPAEPDVPLANLFPDDWPTAECHNGRANRTAAAVARADTGPSLWRPDQHKSHGWHYAATAAFIAIAWIGLLALQTGGQLRALLESAPVVRRAPLDIPFNPRVRHVDRAKAAPLPSGARPAPRFLP